MATKIGRGNYVPDIYSCAKLHYDSIKGFCPHICEVAYQMFTRLVFIFGDSSNSLPPRPLRRKRQKTSFRARMCLLGVPRKFLHFDPIFPRKTQIFGRFSTGFNMGNFVSKHPLRPATPLEVGWWIGKLTQSKDEVSFYPGSRLNPHSAHVRRIQPCINRQIQAKTS